VTGVVQHVEAVNQRAETKTSKFPVCCQCSSNHLRRSKFRPADANELFRLHFPVRCRSCHERQFISIFSILRLRGD
jgi:hypothetical protein